MPVDEAIRRRWTACDLPEWWRKRDHMGINPDLFYSIVRIIGDIELVDVDGASLGSRRGVIGTGFCMRVSGSAGEYAYVLTADHVLQGQAKVEVEVPMPRMPGSMFPPGRATDWRRPLEDVDLAICPLGSIEFGGNVVVNPMHVAELSAVTPGDTIHYVRMLHDLDIPMLRAGTVGAIDQEGIEHAEGYVYPAHLVDCRSYEGFSGSPCFLVSEWAQIENAASFPPLFQPPSHLGALGDLIPIYGLAGMFTEHFHDENPEGAASRYGIGMMVRSQEIGEALMSDDFKNERAEWDEGIEAVQAKRPRPRTARVGKKVVRQPSEFENFEKLTRKLVQTPKSSTSPEEDS